MTDTDRCPAHSDTPSYDTVDGLRVFPGCGVSGLRGIAVPEFRPPTGESLEAVIRDAARQVIEGYGPALRKLACS